MTNSAKQKIQDKKKRETRIAVAITLAISVVLILAGLFFIVIMPSMKSASSKTFGKVGNVVSFGKYEQDNNTDNGAEPIKWKVIAVKDGKALLLAKDILDGRSYEDDGKNVTWETSALRKWINSDFYDSAFSTGEKKQIQTTTLNNQEGMPYTSNETKDKVFILSASELFDYFKTASEIASLPSNFANQQRQVPQSTTFGYFWMRTTGDIDSFDQDKSGKAINVVYNKDHNNDKGSTFALYFANGLMYKGYDVTTVLGVRPAIWVTIK